MSRDSRQDRRAKEDGLNADGPDRLRRHHAGGLPGVHRRSEIGEYVMVHVGFAISKVDAEQAAQTYQYLAEMDQLEEIALTGAGRT